MKSRVTISYLSLAVIAVALFVVDLTTGSVALSWSDVCSALIGTGSETTVKIVRHIRLIKAVVAILAGIALSVSGLQMQTLFLNPLAGPYVLGITSGASLGVAVFILAVPLLHVQSALWGSLGMAGAAWVGAAVVLAVVAAVGSRIKDIMVVLILGMMFSSGVGAIVQILQYLSDEETLKNYVVWTMGSLGDVTASQLWLLVPAVFVGSVLAIMAMKPLNLLLLGEEYAVSMGLDVKRARILIFVSTTLLAGSVTAFCGPIGFIGLAVPHVARALFANADIRVLLPATALTGVVFMLGCDIVSKLLVLPVNSITALLGIPIVVWIVLKIRL